MALGSFIDVIEQACGRRAIRTLLPMQPGDVPVTFAEVDELSTSVGFRPSTQIESGISKFVDWYISYTKNSKEQFVI